MNRWSSRALLLLLGAATVGVLLLSLSVGPYPLGLEQVLQALAAGPSASGDAAQVVWQLRMPRGLAALLVGAALSAAGAAYQGLFRNPLVSPDILGVASGAGLGAALGIYFGFPLPGVQASAFVGGLLAVGTVVFVASRVRRHEPVLVLVLTGVAVGALFSAGISLIKVLADPNQQLPSITFWLLGGLQSATAMDVRVAAPLVLLGMLPLLLLRWRLNVLTLSDEEAHSLGVPVAALRAVVILCATLLSASTVAVAGLVGWVGLVVPHGARLLVGPDHMRLLPTAALLGAAFLGIADLLARSVGRLELPLGILTALVGAPSFLLLLARTGRFR